jgi:orotidine-5'-phosphate decarboxylase
MLSSGSAMTDRQSLLSAKPIPPAERLIFALDAPGPEPARRLVEALADSVTFYKLGLELFLSGGYFELIDWLVARGKRIFADLKLFDVPETVRGAVRALAARPVDFLTVHGQDDGVLAAAASVKGDLSILAVTVLTSLDEEALRRDLGAPVDLRRLVLSRARRALALGCDGVISSGLEVRAIRGELGAGPIVVVPGIRPAANPNRPADDQKRVVTVEAAFASGADYIVVGRPIRSAPDPRAAAAAIQEVIAALFAGASR